MENCSMIYSFVARGAVILAQYSAFTGNFSTIAAECLQKLPVRHNNFTYKCDSHTFNYLVDDGFTYCVVAAEALDRHVPIGFLKRVKDDYKKSYGGPKAATAVTEEFSLKLRDHMQYCIDHPEEMTEHGNVQAQVLEVNGTIIENLEKVLDRQEKILLRVEKTDKLHLQDLKGKERRPLRPILWLPNDEELLVTGVNQMGENWDLVSLFSMRERDAAEKYFRKLQSEGRIQGVQPKLQLLPETLPSKMVKLATKPIIEREQKDDNAKDDGVPFARKDASIMENDEKGISEMLLSAQQRSREIKQESKWLKELNEIKDRVVKLEDSHNLFQAEVLTRAECDAET